MADETSVVGIGTANHYGSVHPDRVRQFPSMQRPVRVVLIPMMSLALAGCGGSSAPAVSTGSVSQGAPTTSVPAASTAVAGASRFASDASALTGALRDYSTTISSVTNASQFPEKSGPLRASAEAFRGAVDRMNDYHLSDPTLEARRARIVDQGQNVASVMLGLADEAPSGNSASVGQAVAKFRRASDAFIRGIQP